MKPLRIKICPDFLPFNTIIVVSFSYMAQNQSLNFSGTPRCTRISLNHLWKVLRNAFFKSIANNVPSFSIPSRSPLKWLIQFRISLFSSIIFVSSWQLNWVLGRIFPSITLVNLLVQIFASKLVSLFIRVSVLLSSIFKVPCFLFVSFVLFGIV